jgi:hypothetical protein
MRGVLQYIGRAALIQMMLFPSSGSFQSPLSSFGSIFCDVLYAHHEGILAKPYAADEARFFLL